MSSFSLFWKNCEPEKHYAYTKLIENENIVFDIGANVGLHSYFIARTFPHTKVIAFEPLPDNHAYIKSTIERNKIKNIELVESAMSSTVGTVFFNKSSNNSQGFITDEKTGLEVNVNTIDNFIITKKIKPDFIKIDVEGAEWKVLEGFRQSIAAILPIMIIELHNPENDRKVADFFKLLPYTMLRLGNPNECKIGKPFRTIKNLKAIWPDPDGVFGNIVLIPENKIENYKHLIA